MWSVAWFFLVYDTPAKHPRISIEEREYIERALATRKGAKVGLYYALEFDIKIYFCAPIESVIYENVSRVVIFATRCEG